MNKLIVVIFAIIVLHTIITWAIAFALDFRGLRACARENNVYKCELVPMPIIGEGAR